MTATLERYRVKASRHYSLNPNWKGNNPHDPARMILHKSGDIIETTEDLIKNWPNKFEKVVEAPIVIRRVTEERKQLVSQIIDGGSFGEVDRDFLEQLKDEDFARIQRVASKTVEQQPIGKMTSILGMDVTDQFQLAYDHQFRVFRHPSSGKYHVTKGDHNKPLKTGGMQKEEVETFVEAQLKLNK